VNETDIQPHILTPEHLSRFATFTCGDEEWCVTLNDFLRENAIPEGADRMNTTYVFYNGDETPVAYATLSASQIDRDRGRSFPLIMLSRAMYPFVPALLIGRLAVEIHQQGTGLGTAILGWIEKMAVELPVGCRFLALHVDVRNTRAVEMYERYGFEVPKHIRPRKNEQLMLYDLIDLQRQPSSSLA